MKTLSDAERLDWLQLIRTQTIGPVTFAQLLSRFGSARAAIDALPALASKAGRRKTIRLASRSAAEDEIAQADKIGARLIASCEADFPAPLAQIPGAPPLIYMRGHTSLFDKPAVAIIGARNASAVGRKIARNLAEGLGAADIVVVSGLARGIDGAAHEASLSTGAVAVVAGGVDVIYPPEHEALTAAIAERGAVISEQPPGATPTARDFPKRNRIISGLSRGVVVVEAAAKSGTLITARFALEQGREVFAVPGSPLDPRCQGANRLIRDGATLVENAQDILDALAQQGAGAMEAGRDLFDWGAGEAPGDDCAREIMAKVRSQVLEALSYTPLHRDEILREIETPTGLILDALLDLVLSGEAEEHSGGRFSLAAN
ncbi:MAG: DNA-processing protein DprA [Parvularculaceae bacterium]|nr:DNA-processing protein DprA [Parvularculaceae bacterium]